MELNIAKDIPRDEMREIGLKLLRTCAQAAEANKDDCVDVAQVTSAAATLISCMEAALMWRE